MAATPYAEEGEILEPSPTSEVIEISSDSDTPQPPIIDLDSPSSPRLPYPTTTQPPSYNPHFPPSRWATASLPPFQSSTPSHTFAPSRFQPHPTHPASRSCPRPYPTSPQPWFPPTSDSHPTPALHPSSYPSTRPPSHPATPLFDTIYSSPIPPTTNPYPTHTPYSPDRIPVTDHPTAPSLHHRPASHGPPPPHPDLLFPPVQHRLEHDPTIPPLDTSPSYVDNIPLPAASYPRFTAHPPVSSSVPEQHRLVPEVPTMPPVYQPLSREQGAPSFVPLEDSRHALSGESRVHDVRPVLARREGEDIHDGHQPRDHGNGHAAEQGECEEDEPRPVFERAPPVGVDIDVEHVAQPLGRRFEAGVEEVNGASKLGVAPEADARQDVMVKKTSKPNLLELRRKVMMSMMGKLKGAEEKADGDLTSPAEAGRPQPDSGMQVKVVAKFSSVDVPADETFAKHYYKSATPSLHDPLLANVVVHQRPTLVQLERLLVEPDTESEASCASESSDEVCDDENERGKESVGPGLKQTPRRTREEIIEEMKIRTAQIGKCPGMLDKQRISKPSPSAMRPTISSPIPKSSPSDSVHDDVLPRPKVSDAGTLGGNDGAKLATTRQKLDECEVKPDLDVSPTDVDPKTLSTALPKESVLDSDSPKTEQISRDSSTRDLGRKLVPSGSPHVAPTNAQSGPSSNRNKNIMLLKKKIADLEARKDRHRRSIASDVTTNPSLLVNSMRISTSPAAANPSIAKPKTLHAGVLGNTTKRIVDPNIRPTLDATSNGRYYRLEPSTKKTLDSEKKTRPELTQNPVTSKKQSGDHERELIPWNQRRKLDAFQDAVISRADDGLVDDLKSELESQKKQIACFQEYSRLVHASDMALSQAAAKVSFKRQRVLKMEDDLKRAQFDLLDTEQDFEKIEHASKRLRLTLDDRGLSDMFPLPEISIAKSENIDHGHATSTGKANVQSAREGQQAGVDGAADIECELDISKASGRDPILQQSPYSPSSGDMYLSCLSGLRAFIMRIPHHNKATDRKSFSPLSPTWTISLDPMKAICPRELRRPRSCMDKKCEFEHLRDLRQQMGLALGLVDRVQAYLGETSVAAEKKILRAKIDLYSGKDTDETVSSLICSLFPSPGSAPFSRSST